MAVNDWVSGEAVIATEWTFLTLTATLIFARFYLRVRILNQKIIPSDILICGAWCASVTCASFDIALKRLGFLHPNVSITFEGFEDDVEKVEAALKVFSFSTMFPTTLSR